MLNDFETEAKCEVAEENEDNVEGEEEEWQQNELENMLEIGVSELGSSSDKRSLPLPGLYSLLIYL